ncbi:unnamed protein product [Linum tenue]|uniref:Uncharacterized protein n=1 Tax=Linum tenue TaxID=586396 RepID=A0AAV0QUS9_9ROSI|nr:unnamed protein product [Linum tenue]
MDNHPQAIYWYSQRLRLPPHRTPEACDSRQPQVEEHSPRPQRVPLHIGFRPASPPEPYSGAGNARDICSRGVQSSRAHQNERCKRRN